MSKDLHDERNVASDQRPDDELLRQASYLARDITPSRDLWPEIANAITVSPRAAKRLPYPWTWLAQAAAIVLLIGGSSALTYLAVKRDPQVVEVPVTTQLVARPASFDASRALGAGFQDARASLELRLDRELQRLSPAARAEVDRNLKVIRTAIADINTALANEPNNVLLQSLLLKTYREELATMSLVGRLTNDVMVRNDI